MRHCFPNAITSRPRRFSRCQIQVPKISPSKVFATQDPRRNSHSPDPPRSEAFPFPEEYRGAIAPRYSSGNGNASDRGGSGLCELRRGSWVAKTFDGDILGTWIWHRENRRGRDVMALGKQWRIQVLFRCQVGNEVGSSLFDE